MGGNSQEIFVRCEQRKPVLEAGCRDQKVDWAGQNSFGSTERSDSRCSHVDLAVQFEKRKSIHEGEQAVELLRRSEAV